MACVERVRLALEKALVPWTRIEHRRSEDPHEIALAAHVRGRRLLRVVVLQDRDARPVMFVHPASERFDPARAEAVAGWGPLRPVRQEELERLFPDCEPGAIPPFGRLYGMPAVLDRCFFDTDEGEDAEIFFEAGNHREVIAMRFGDFRRVAGPFAHEACVHERPRADRHVKHGGRGAMV